MPSTVDCPSCGHPLPPAAPTCPSCALPLSGPLAAELWRTDQQLLALQRHRGELIGRLRQGADDTLTGPAAAGAVVAPRTAWSGQQVLLGVGALLVLTAAVVFLAVAWSAIGVGGQVAVMALLTAATTAAALRLARRGLTATAQTLAAVAVGLAGVDLAAAHALDLAGLGRLDRVGYAAGAAALLALACGLAAWRAPALHAFPLAAALAGAAVPLLGVEAADAGWTTTALVLGLAAAAAALVADRLPRRPVARVALLVVGAGLLLSSWATAAVAVLDGPVLGSGGLAALVALAAAAGAGRRAGLGQSRLRHPVLGYGALVAAALTVAGLTWPADPPGSVSATLAVVAALVAAALSWSRPQPTGDRARLLLGLQLVAASALVLAGIRHLDAPRPLSLLPVATLTAGLGATALAAALVARDMARLRAGATGYAAALVLLAAAVAGEPVGAAATAVALVVLAVAAAVLAAWRRGGPEEPVLAGAWAVAVLAALGQASETSRPAVLSAVVLAVAGLLALAHGVLPRRGWAAVLGSLLCSAAVWTLLLDRDVTTVEAYALPLAALVGGVGLVRLRRQPGTPSWLTVGPALGVGLLPSAVASVDDPGLTRPLLVLVAGTVVLLLGVRLRWLSPVVAGALALAVVAVAQLAPYAVGLPRWLSFGAVGTVLLVLGARYEQRRRNARQALAWVTALR
ncbi:hypothetical protein SAMN04488543_1833 [Friedmanniella luteola]|uniref:Uncharacterized protein n=1 Tax=Friedmanniella luteola TaxID=546871 RepID=A0A1H1SMH5_9ACTN|nr:zinc ribbon domain-containing protein [Friedmanniella luteola]SDS49224.1 hypothetical protein SAMN04488543_1833 [Friedmanniella luteola]